MNGFGKLWWYQHKKMAARKKVGRKRLEFPERTEEKKKRSAGANLREPMEGGPEAAGCIKTYSIHLGLGHGRGHGLVRHCGHRHAVGGENALAACPKGKILVTNRRPKGGQRPKPPAGCLLRGGRLDSGCRRAEKGTCGDTSEPRPRTTMSPFAGGGPGQERAARLGEVQERGRENSVDARQPWRPRRRPSAGDEVKRPRGSRTAGQRRRARPDWSARSE